MVNRLTQLSLVTCLLLGCSGNSGEDAPSAGASSSESGGNASTGGASTGGASTGGSSTGGSTSGASASGGFGSGGVQTGGAPATGGTATGGTATGGTATGGTATGGTATGGTATGGAPATGGTATGGTAAFTLPPANAPFDYQLGGAYQPPAGVKVVSRDRNAPPATGLYNICYVNGFQSQPDEASLWTKQHPDLVLRDAGGNPVMDPDWGEMLLDTSTEAKRAALAVVVGDWIKQCAKDGYDAVEVDNLDSYSRSGGRLTQANNVAFMRRLADVAHAAGLAVAQKNSTELLSQAKAMATDFAVAEECNRWGECAAYKTAYGARVFVIEYRKQDFDKGCSGYPELSIVLRNLNVSPPGSSGYVFSGC